MPPWSLQNSQNWLIFSHVEKNCQKNCQKNKNPVHHPMSSIHTIIVKIKIPCTRVHGFEEKSKFRVPGYIDLKKKQNSIYPGTWCFVFSSNPCTRVHGFLIFTIIVCIELMGWWTGFLFFYFFGNFFQHVKKLINFRNFVKIKVAKFKLNHLG